MKKYIIAAILMLAYTVAAYAFNDLYPTYFTRITGTASSAGYQTATHTTVSPTVIQFRSNVAGTYLVGTGTAYPFAAAENVRMILAGTATFKLASSAGASYVYIQHGSNTARD